MALTMHVVFKTHLDVGFTHFAAVVKRRYFDHFIPTALAIARELRQAGGQDRFVWTTGSWILYEYLEQADPAGRKAAEAGILAGDLRWHGLPFTVHSELMDQDLFRYGLSLSRELDRRFGVQTVAAKMTDVPGHTRGVVPLMAEAGLKFLHIGVNHASSAPTVPDVFRWREPDSRSEIMVMYHKAAYGSVTTVDGLDHALAFAHTGDNQGPQSRAQIVEELARLRAEYPAYQVRASTLDAFAQELDSVRGSLPVVEQEIGDTWVYGTASYPSMVAEFRELQRLRSRWLKEGGAAVGDPSFERFSRQLLSVPEHTWGVDQKMYLADYRNYSRKDFERARALDTVVDGIPDELSSARGFAHEGVVQSYRLMEASWLEHRAYLERARAALRGTPLGAEADRAAAACHPTKPTADRPVPALALQKGFDLRHFTARISPVNGALISLVEKETGRDWASPAHPLGLFRYQTFSSGDYDRFYKEYVRNLDEPGTYAWAAPDYGRLGLKPEHSESAISKPKVVRVRRSEDTFVVELLLPARPRSRYGAPAEVTVCYRFPRQAPTLEVEVSWFGKPANRMPEASWFSFSPVVRDPSGWRMEKLGHWVSPLDVVGHGNRYLHGVGEGVRIQDGAGRLVIESQDAHLASPGEPRALRFDDALPPLAGGMHFCLHANLFGTNFPLWYGEDGRFRFRLRFERSQ